MEENRSEEKIEQENFLKTNGRATSHQLTVPRTLNHVGNTSANVLVGNSVDSATVTLRTRSDEGFFAEVERQSRDVPGPGSYFDWPGTTPYNYKIETRVRTPVLSAPSGKFDLFPNEGNPGPGTYEAEQSQVALPSFRVGERGSFIDEAVNASQNKPGPGAHTSHPMNHPVNLGGRWGTVTPADPPSEKEKWPGPGAYSPQRVGHESSTAPRFTQEQRSTFMDECVAAAARTPAPDRYAATVDNFKPREAPFIERRFGTRMIFSERGTGGHAGGDAGEIVKNLGPNPGAFLHATSSERGGGFRKVGPQEYVAEYRARLRQTLNAPLAYALPSTLTTMGKAPDESAYACQPGDGGTWTTIPTGGAVYKNRKKRAPRTQQQHQLEEEDAWATNGGCLHEEPSAITEPHRLQSRRPRAAASARGLATGGVDFSAVSPPVVEPVSPSLSCISTSTSASNTVASTSSSVMPFAPDLVQRPPPSASASSTALLRGPRSANKSHPSSHARDTSTYFSTFSDSAGVGDASKAAGGNRPTSSVASGRGSRPAAGSRGGGFRCGDSHSHGGAAASRGADTGTTAGAVTLAGAASLTVGEYKDPAFPAKPRDPHAIHENYRVHRRLGRDKARVRDFVKRATESALKGISSKSSDHASSETRSGGGGEAGRGGILEEAGRACDRAEKSPQAAQHGSRRTVSSAALSFFAASSSSTSSSASSQEAASSLGSSRVSSERRVQRQRRQAQKSAAAAATTRAPARTVPAPGSLSSTRSERSAESRNMDPARAASGGVLGGPSSSSLMASAEHAGSPQSHGQQQNSGEINNEALVKVAFAALLTRHAKQKEKERKSTAATAMSRRLSKTGDFSFGSGGGGGGSSVLLSDASMSDLAIEDEGATVEEAPPVPVFGVPADEYEDDEDDDEADTQSRNRLLLTGGIHRDHRNRLALVGFKR